MSFFCFVFERVFIQADVKRSFTNVYHNNRKVLEDFTSQLTHSIVVDYRSSLNQHLKRGPKTNNLPDNREPWNQVQLNWHLTTIRAAAFGKQLDPFLSPTRMQLEPWSVQIRMLLQLIVAQRLKYQATKKSYILNSHSVVLILRGYLLCYKRPLRFQQKTNRAWRQISFDDIQRKRPSI